jgi:hypothetical protein
MVKTMGGWRVREYWSAGETESGRDEAVSFASDISPSLHHSLTLSLHLKVVKKTAPLGDAGAGQNGLI